MKKFYYLQRTALLKVCPKKTFRIIKIINLILLITFLNAYGSPGMQQQVVTGTITESETGENMPGVNIVVKGATIGAITGADGKYSITVPDKNVTLVFSFIGYKALEVPVAGRSVVDVALIPEAQSLDEVIVIGYGTQKKVNVIGSVVNVGSEQLDASPVAKISNALAGRLPGAIIQQASGAPGEDEASILIRGNATLGNKNPLIVIDGIPGRDLNSVEPGDIESLTVLKDASAAIYGARAANGVVLVTTKRGTEGAPIFKYDYYLGFEQPTILPKVCDAPTYAQMMREQQSYRGVTEANMAYSLEDVEKYKSGKYPWTHPQSDFFDATLKPFSNTSHHSLSVTGGTKAINYYLSFGKLNDNGLYRANSATFDRYNLKMNADVKLNEYLTIGLDISGSEEDRMNPGWGGDWDHMIRGRPTDHAIFPNGLPGPNYAEGPTQSVMSTSLEGGFNDDKRWRTENRISVNFKVPKIDGLSISGYYAYDMYFRKVKEFQKPFYVYNIDKEAYYDAGNTGVEDGSDFLIASYIPIAEPRLTEDRYDSKSTNFLAKINYEKTINDIHNISAFVAVESSEYELENIEAFRRYFVSDQLPYLFAGGSAELNNNSSVELDARLNYFGRLSYNFKEKYLVEFSLRRDGSLRFSEESGRWGTFPSVLAGWRASSEDFWKNNINFIDYFKLRASWGQMGNDEVDAFQYLTSYGFQYGYGMTFGSNKLYESSLGQTGVPNPNITWEVANVYNLGFESFLFKNKVNFDFEAFYQRRSQILVKRNASVPNFTGMTLPDENFGIVDSRGFETILGFTERAGAFSYSISGNFAFARNKIIEYDEPARNVSWQVLTGHPIGAEILYKYIGIFNDDEDVASYPHVTGAKPGDIIIEDYDKDGKITYDDQIIFDKTATPEITYGISFSFGYKNFELSGLIQGTGSTWKRVEYMNMGLDGNYYAYYGEGRWTPDNITAEKPRTFVRTEEYWRSTHRTDFDYNNRAFSRMKNLQLSYTIPGEITKKIRLRGAKIYLTGQNLFLLYNAFVWKVDPELADVSNHPLMRTYAGGVQIQF